MKVSLFNPTSVKTVFFPDPEIFAVVRMESDRGSVDVFIDCPQWEAAAEMLEKAARELRAAAESHAAEAVVS